MFPIFGQNQAGEVVIERMVDADALKMNGDTIHIVDDAPLNARKNPILPYTGKHGILTRYLHDTLTRFGQGPIRVDIPAEYLECHRYTSIESTMSHLGVSNTTTGVYFDGERGVNDLFVNMGSGAVIFENIFENAGPVRINYYGDTIGWRQLELTPYAIAAEILNDLNEAFKMMIKYAK